MVDVADMLSYFQAITGIEDLDLCTEILQAHGWDLELAVSLFAPVNPPDGSNATPSARPDVEPPSSSGSDQVEEPSSTVLAVAGRPSLTWRLVTLPVSVISGGLGLISGAVGLGMRITGGVLSHSLGAIGMDSSSDRPDDTSARLIPVSAAATEAVDFVAAFDREYGSIPTRPNFVSEGFMDALQRSRDAYKLLFLYLHSPDHPDTPVFCERTLCNEEVAAFVNDNFVPWGGSIRASEGFKMSNSLKASRFPFCAVIMAAANQRIALLQQVEGPKTPVEMLMFLQAVFEESAPVLDSARRDAEERINNMRLREEQNAAYRAALEVDQAKERRRKEEQEQLAREAAEAERKLKEEEEACLRAEQEAADKAAAIAKLREEKALSLGAEPDKGPDVTRVLVRFPAGQRKERRFRCDAAVQSLYDYADSLGYLEIGNYTLVSNFPRVIYGSDKLSLTLKEAGLHPQASLFVELNSSD
ncbi:hypothetical protein SAY87_029400 [Trapa incisa]|uniref:UBX domain-containing protein n=1 Tax=Trapa incisa TaxID=236973 RepID=A0AAN7K7G5_9MYRT|nr:hypothetical protein SAY87_029400 [Trapa incisa]